MTAAFPIILGHIEKSARTRLSIGTCMTTIISINMRRTIRRVNHFALGPP